MTPTERARKILDSCRLSGSVINRGIEKRIAAQIEEAEREAVNKAYFNNAQYAEGFRAGREEVLNEQKCKVCGCSYERCTCNPVREANAFKKGFHAAREKAIEIVDDAWRASKGEK